MLYMVTFTINIPPMLAYIPYMDPMGYSLVQQEMGKISRTLFWRFPEMGVGPNTWMVCNGKSPWKMDHDWGCFPMTMETSIS